MTPHHSPSRCSHTDDVRGTDRAPPGDDAQEPTTAWTRLHTGTDATLTDVAFTARGPYLVGTGGTVLRPAADGWEPVAPRRADAADYRAAAATADGQRLWLVGDRGTVRSLDVGTGAFVGGVGPTDVDADVTDLAVAWGAGEASVVAVDDAGRLHYSADAGARDSWRTTQVADDPLVAVDCHDGGFGHAVAADGTVSDVRGAHATPAGTLPVPGTPRGLASLGADAYVVTATDGSVVRVADGETRVASLAHAPLADVVQSDGRSYAVGGDGVAFTGRDGRWLAQDTGVDAALHAVATDVATVAVGRHGTVLVR